MNCWLAVAAVGAVVTTGCNTSERTNLSSSALLSRAEAATAETDYEGEMKTRTLINGQWIASDVRAYFHKQGMSRLEYMSPPMKGVVIVHSRDCAWRYDPATGRVVVTPGAVRGTPERDFLTQKNYRIIAGAHVMIAGRDTLQIDVVPRNPGNPWRRFWMDTEKQVLLGWEHFNAQGHPKSVSQFESVEFKDVPGTLFEQPRETPAGLSPPWFSRPLSIPALQKAVGFPLVMPALLPKGYRLEHNYLTQCEDGCGAAVALTLFTDGVNSLSFFQTSHPVPVSPHHDQHVLRLVRGGRNYILVGDLDAKLLQAVIDSIPTVPHLPDVSHHPAALHQ
jgi:outer membrane lipoprotein-sorting protein